MEVLFSIQIAWKISLKGAGGSAESALLPLNQHNFLNTEPVYTKLSFKESLLNYLAFEI